MGNQIIWGAPNLNPNGEIATKRFFSDVDEAAGMDLPETKGNQIYFWDDVWDGSVYRMIRNLRNIADRLVNDSDYKTVEPIPIWVYVNSYGGDLLAGFNAMDEIQNINKKVPIYTVVDGKSASAATFINLAGKKRFIKKNGFMLIHELSSMTWGKMKEQEDHMKNMKMFMGRIKDIYLNATKIGESDLDEMLKHDIWLDAKTSLEYGLVDAIV